MKSTLKIKRDPAVEAVFNNYPAHVQGKMQRLRDLIIETAHETEGINRLEETLRWGEPSYITPKGSTLRIDWKPKLPEQYAIYCQCTSLLIPTFRIVYDGVFEFEGKRAIVFPLNESLPEAELKQCIAAGLTYHKIKHLPLLGL